MNAMLIDAKADSKSLLRYF